MKCPFCAEEIQEEAVICRFCGATSEKDGWKPPAPHRYNQRDVPPKGRRTLRLAGALFLVSAALELLSLTSDVVAAGSVRTGAWAMAYHLGFAALYVTVGIGLWSLRAWGHAVTLIGVAIYSIDRLWFLLDDASMKAWISIQTSGFGGIEGMDGLVDLDQIASLAKVMTVTFLACWWGFGLYVHLKRGLFTTRTRG